MFPQMETFGTRDRLIMAALQLIAEGGADSFSAGALIKRAGVSKGALYHHFESLEQLLIEAVNFRVQERLVKAQRIYTSYADLGSWLQAYFEEMLAFASGPAFLNMVLYFNQKGLVQDEIRLHLCHNNDAYLERMARTIQHFYPQPIEQSRLHGIASMILFTVEGVAAHGALQQNRERFKSSWQWLIQVILRDLAPYERSSV